MSESLPHLHKGKVLVHVDLYGQHRVARGRAEFRLMHLVVEECDH